MRIVFIVLTSILLSGCATMFGPDSKNRPSAPYAGYIAINPISLPPDLFDDTNLNQTPIKTPSKSSLTSNGNPNLKYLINNAARVSIREVTNNGKVKYIASGLSKKET